MKQLLVRYDPKQDLSALLEPVTREWGNGSYGKLLIHIYSAFSEEALLTELCTGLKKILPEAMIVGAVSAGEICHAKMMEPGILISAMLFETTDVRVVKYSGVKGAETEVGRTICRKISDIPMIKAVELIMTGTEFNTRLIFEELSLCKEGVQIFGGYAGGHSMDVGEHFIFDENGLTDDKIFAIFYAGADFHIDVDKTVGWQQLGHHFTVTKADENRMIEINNRPAVEVYEKYLQIDRNGNFAEETFEFPLIAKVEDDELLRHTITVEEDGTLDLAGYVTEGMKIYLCFGNPSLIVSLVNDRLKQVRAFKPQAILLYSCSVRKSFWESFVDMEMLPFEKLAVTAGFHTWGEVKRNPTCGSVLEYNITLLSIAMREGDPPEEEYPEARIDDTVLKGQASLIKRLTTLVAATTTELQNAYNNLEAMNQRLSYMSQYDALTGIYNRRKLEEVVEENLSRAGREGGKVSLLMFDIDLFKNVNDTYGHAVGDTVLMEMSRIFREEICGVPEGHVGRWGGEEFFAVVPNYDAPRALALAETIREKVAACHFTGVLGPLTVSIGVITADGTEERMVLYKRVDDCLYHAKQNGRNRVVAYEDWKSCE